MLFVVHNDEHFSETNLYATRVTINWTEFGTD